MADLSPVAKETLELLEPGRREHNLRTSKYDNAYDVYRATRKPADAEAWQSKLRVPYGMQVIDTALVNIVSGKPRVRVFPRQPQDEEAAKAMQHLLDYFMTEDHFVEKQPTFVQQGLIFGVTVAKNHWLTRKSERLIRRTNPLTGRLDITKAIVLDRDGPTFEPWDVYQCFWDPDARDVDSAAYVVLESWVTKDDLEAMRYSADTRLGVYHNLDDLYRSGVSDDGSSRAQNKVIGNEKRKGKFQIWEVWRETPKGLRLTVLGNKHIVLRDDPTPYWHGKKPVVITQTRPDLFDLHGIPETELVDHLQEALWTVQNMRFDNMHLTVMRGVTYREGGVTDPDALELRPRFKWPVQDHDDVKPFEVAPLPPEAYQEEEQLLGRMQLVTGINPYISGSDLDTVDQNTATGVTALQEVASRLLRFKASQIHWKGYQRSYEQWSEMIQQLLDRKVAVKITGPGGMEEWKEYGPQEVVGSYDIKLEGSEESLSRRQERGEAVALMNAFAPFADRVNLQPLLERVAAAYDFPNPQALIQAPQAPPAAAPGGPGPQANVPSNVDPRIAQAILNGGR